MPSGRSSAKFGRQTGTVGNAIPIADDVISAEKGCHSGGENELDEGNDWDVADAANQLEGSDAEEFDQSYDVSAADPGGRGSPNNGNGGGEDKDFKESDKILEDVSAVADVIELNGEEEDHPPPDVGAVVEVALPDVANGCEGGGDGGDNGGGGGGGDGGHDGGGDGGGGGGGGRPRRGEQWGPFQIAPIYKRGQLKGYGATCKKHHDAEDRLGTCCKKQIVGVTGIERRLCMWWLVLGADISNHGETRRSDHVFGLRIRDLGPPPSEAELVRLRRARWGS